jgi:hypothetical protein
MRFSVGLLLLGGVFELGGVVLAVLDLKRTREEMQRYERRPVTVYPGPARVEVGIPAPTISTGREPTTEERLERMEGQVRQLRDDVDSLPRDIRDQLRKEISEATERAEEGARDRLDALDALLKGVIRPRLRGVVLVAVGIVLSVVGGVLPEPW